MDQKSYLGAENWLLNMEWKVFLSTIEKRDFSLAPWAGWIGDYIDANTFLHTWRTGDKATTNTRMVECSP